MITRIFLPLLFTTIGLGFGFCIGASKFEATLGDIKWTDVGSLLITTTGFIIAFLTYIRWLKTKIKDDAYQTTRQYLNLVFSIKVQLINLANEYNHLVPSPGMLLEDESMVKLRIGRCNEIYSLLSKTGFDISLSKEQMSFWKIKLTEDGEKIHREILKLITDHLIHSNCLNTNIHYHYFHDASKVDSLNQQLEKWRTVSKSILDVNEKIISAGFHGIFKVQV